MSGTNVTSFSPAQIGAAYHFPPATGRGERIALIELGGGYHADDLAACFRGLDPAPAVTAVPVESRDAGLPLRGTNSPLGVAAIGDVIDALGQPGATFAALERQFAADHVWSQFLYTFEVTLDVEIAGTLANGAAIDVYFAALGADGLAAAITAAVATEPTVISISWGGTESWWLGPNGANAAAVGRVDAALALAHDHDITVCCSSGDWGAAGALVNPDGLAHVNFPASSPHALACGGTSLRLTGDQRAGEVVWNTTVFGAPRASGGGMSGRYPRPAYQQGLATPAATGAWTAAGSGAPFDGRWLPDVAGHADRASGYAIVLGGRPFVADGTSAVCPLWAALLARVSEALGRPVGWINDRLYRAAGAGTHDVTEGDNAVPGTAVAFTATSGWDPCTGWGSPDGEALLRVLA